ncbi:MAG TPA: hypothetical protein VEF76_00065 [Patescibacteria group bacterium]|nr:hypothetical protein [Patescibacteria group bacterium]
MSDSFTDIITVRHAIRRHRDAKGDDRCWLDDYFVWALIPGSFAVPTAVPPMEEAMDMCRGFYKRRRADTADEQSPDAVTDPQQWDKDLEAMDDAALQAELARIRAAVRTHRDAACAALTLDDDRALYRVLPEKVAADFRLPPESVFLGEAGAPKAGCPAFWRSHAHCRVKRHNLPQWGPCDEVT